MIRLNQNNLEIIREVNALWNSRIRYCRDIDIYGVKELWTFPKKHENYYLGDCEDYAIAKKKALLEQDIECWFATCWCFPDRTGYHAVLIIHSDHGIIVLDNRYKILRLAKNTEYTWHLMEIKDNKWVNFKDRTPARPPRGYTKMMAKF